MSDDIAPEVRANKQQEKAAKARLRECLDKERTHIRLGDWIGESARSYEQVTLIGTVRELHGTVCTCCPRRTS